MYVLFILSISGTRYDYSSMYTVKIKIFSKVSDLCNYTVETFILIVKLNNFRFKRRACKISEIYFYIES